MFVPRIDEHVQDLIGHWYRVLDVQASGWRFKVEQVYVTHDTETGSTQFRSYGDRPIVMGRSDFKFGKE